VVSAPAIETAPNSDVVTNQQSIKQNDSQCDCNEFKRIKEIGGEVVIDGSIRVLEPVYSKVFDLVEVSTPVTPATNHARLFLRADGTKQSLVVIFDDATVVKIAGN
jgi:hypothetical protein